ncbi:hypothetical protein HYU13_01620 [Candidatus Woesearchaeota archaeon]|nr:hypothetical protein [Candidatus Woesearchaeota archaeon]
METEKGPYFSVVNFFLKRSRAPMKRFFPDGGDVTDIDQPTAVSYSVLDRKREYGELRGLGKKATI